MFHVFEKGEGTFRSITTPPDLVLSMHRPLTECIMKSTAQAGPIIIALFVQPKLSVLYRIHKGPWESFVTRIPFLTNLKWSRSLPKPLVRLCACRVCMHLPAEALARLGVTSCKIQGRTNSIRPDLQGFGVRIRY